jgi:hypothetical protein
VFPQAQPRRAHHHAKSQRKVVNEMQLACEDRHFTLRKEDQSFCNVQNGVWKRGHVGAHYNLDSWWKPESFAPSENF